MKEEEKKSKVKKGSKKDDRLALQSQIWGTRRVTRLNNIVNPSYCGTLTVREFVSLVLLDAHNFPRGLDTPMCIGDFEGNFRTNILSIMTGGRNSDHVCVTGDPHGCME